MAWPGRGRPYDGGWNTQPERFNLPRKQETTKSLYGEGYDGSIISTVVARWVGSDGERERETFLK